MPHERAHASMQTPTPPGPRATVPPSPGFRGTAVAPVAAVAMLVHSVFVLAAEPGTEGFELQGDPAAGRVVYERHCVTCHGPGGTGDGREGQAFDPGPSDFTRIEPDAQRFYRATRDGGMAVGLSGAMPAFRHTLSDEEIQDVVAHLVRLAQ